MLITREATSGVDGSSVLHMMLWKICCQNAWIPVHAHHMCFVQSSSMSFIELYLCFNLLVLGTIWENRVSILLNFNTLGVIFGACSTKATFAQWPISPSNYLSAIFCVVRHDVLISWDLVSERRQIEKVTNTLYNPTPLKKCYLWTTPSIFQNIKWKIYHSFNFSRCLTFPYTARNVHIYPVLAMTSLIRFMVL